MSITGFQETGIGQIPEHWSVTILDSVVKVKGGKRLPKGAEYSDTITNHAYIRVVDFDNLSVNMSDLRYITPEIHQKVSRYTISSNDVFISIAGTIGSVGTVPPELDGANLTENAAKLSIDDTGQLDNRFLAYWLASDIAQAEIDVRTTKTSQPKLALMRIRQIPIPLPPIAEQRRIAAVLNTLQDAIAAQDDVIAATQAFKRSLMQRLFTYGPGREPAETKETEIGEIPEHWEVVRLGDMITLKRGYDLPKRNRIDGTIPIVSSSGVTGMHNAAKVEAPGVVTGRYGTIGEVFYVESDFWPHNTTLYVQEFNGHHRRYIAYFLSTLQLGLLNDKTSIPGINRNDAHAMTVGLPPPVEQSTIADMIYMAEQKIDAEEDRKSALEALFKSMLHQLMTGQIRLRSDAGLPVVAESRESP